MAAASDSASPLLRRGLLGLALLTSLGTAVELGMEHHWTQPVQLIAWAAVAVSVAAIALLLGGPSRARVRLAQVLAALAVLSAAAGIWEHVQANYEAGPLDFHYATTWDSLSEASHWWLAVTKSVGPSPPLAPGALAEAGLCVLLATARHPALRARPDPSPTTCQDRQVNGIGNTGRAASARRA